MLAYLIGILVASFGEESIGLMIFLCIFALGILSMMSALIVTLIKRLKEIEEEDEDDLSKY